MSSPWPNLDALAHGCVSTDLENWPRLKAEARGVLEENERLKNKIRFQAGYQTSEEIKMREENKKLKARLKAGLAAVRKERNRENMIHGASSRIEEALKP